MLVSYLKLAWKVLLRRKFFTFISLFGTSITLMILLVVMSVFDHVVGAQAPEKRSRQLLFFTTLQQQFKEGGSMNTPVSAYFIDHYVRPMKTPALVGITSMTKSATAFADQQSLTLDVRYTDGNYWKTMDFDFLDGRSYSAHEVANADRLCVISEHTARAFFGTVRGVAGRLLEIGPMRYRVVGVVSNVPVIRLYSSADLWLPYTLSTGYSRASRIDGEFMPVLLAPTPSEVPAMRAEFDQVMRRIENPDPKRIKRIIAHADPILGSITRQLTMHQASDSDGQDIFLLVCAVLGLLLMLLPALNLVSLNVTRILERASEIGVRKAFGASDYTLVMQFLVENLVLTGLSSLLGLALAAGVLRLLNESHLIAYSHFGLDWRAFGWGLALALVFGLMSGVYPARKMSRLNPVDALRGGGPG